MTGKHRMGRPLDYPAPAEPTTPTEEPDGTPVENPSGVFVPRPYLEPFVGLA